MEKIIDDTKIFNFIQENNLTPKEFCKRCRVPLTVLDKIKNNDLNYNIVYLLRIAKVMDIDFRVLIIG